MPSLIYFYVGIAIASCLPIPLNADPKEHLLSWVLGGVCALMPDLLSAFSPKRAGHDQAAAALTPDPLNKDPQMIADGLVTSLMRAYESRSTTSLSLNPIPLTWGKWQGYQVRVLAQARRVEVSFTDHTEQAHAVLYIPLRVSGPAAFTINKDQINLYIDAQDTEVLLLSRQNPASSWSHSLPTGLILALGAAVALGPTSALVASAAYLSHLVLDQVGPTGCSWFAPFSRGHCAGLRWLPGHSTKINLLVFIICTSVILANLH